ncbi:MAG: O-antigen ligase family protein [Pseudomonadota bacterium]
MIRGESLLNFLSPFLLLSYMFVGDYMLGEAPAFLVVWFSVLLFRYIGNSPITRSEIVVQAILFLILSPYLLKLITTISEYNYWVFSSILLVNVVPLFSRSIDSAAAGVGQYVLIIASFFAGVVIWGGVREGLVFGPNVLYRVFGVVAFLSLTRLYSYHEDGVDSGLLKAVLPLCLLSFSIFATGSRGGVVVVFFMVIFFLFLVMKKKSIAYVSPFLLGFFYWVFDHWVAIQSAVGRSLQFGISEGSGSVRLILLKNASDYIDQATLGEVIFGAGHPNRFYPVESLYPHNFFVELLVYHGVYLTAIVATSLVLSAYAFKKSVCFRKILLIFLPVYVGAMFSGQFMDHPYLVSLPIVIALYGFFSKKQPA